ncbi:MAG: YIP1 family protein [Acholeplasmataceae bacterium]|nr:YIP1 family protein [Acholeplasmataceae bacterium]
MKTKFLDGLKAFYLHYFKFPKYVLFHPFDGYDELKRYKKGKMSVAFVFITLYAFFRIFAYQREGFLINERNPLHLNSLQEIFAVILLLVLFTVGNWSVTTLMEGKGKFKEIVMVTGYSLFPLILIGYPAVILSNFLTLEEMALYQLLMGFAYVATGWMLFMGILNIHEYGLGKTILAFILTIVAMAAMIFFGLLFFDLIQQVIEFFSSIYEELSLRY